MDGIRFPRIVVIAVALVVAAGCVADGPGPDAATTEPPGHSTTTTSMPAVVGETEVQVVSRLPVLRLEWRTVEVDLEDTGAWPMSLVNVDGEFVVSALAWDSQMRTQTLSVWRSADTVDWKPTDTVLTDAWINQVLSVGGRLVALGSSADPAGPGEPRLWIDDGSGWEAVDLGVDADPGSSLYLYGAAATDAGLLLAGDRQPYDPIEPTILSTGGFRIEIDDDAGTYTVTEEATGRMRSSGPMSDIYRWSETGQILYDPGTGDVLTEVPWDRWSELYPGSTPLPIAIPADPGAALPAIEYDGLRITIDDANGVFEIVRLDSGRVISGTLEELYRGVGPRFLDDQTGETVLALTWQEWDDLMSRSWEGRYEEHEPHETEIVVLFSPDSVTWEVQTLNLAPNSHLESVTAVSDRFVVTAVEHYDGGSNRMAWISDDGRVWENVGTSGSDVRSQLAVLPDSLVALVEGPGGPSVASSTDGLAWREELSVGTQSDGREAWLDLLGAGPLGTAVSSTIAPATTTAWLTVTVGERTARFGPEWAVEISETVSGDVLLALTWDQVENPDGDAPAVYRDGATWFYDAGGQLVLRIPDEDVYAAYDAQSQANEREVQKVLFLKTPAGLWFEATPPPVSERGSDQLMAVGDDQVVIGRVIWRQGEFDDGVPESIHLLVGTLAR